MQIKRYGGCALLISALASQVVFGQDRSQSANKRPTITVKLLPPDDFRSPNCVDPGAGFLVIMKSSEEVSKLSAEQIGQYVLNKMKNGYVVTLHPQKDGRIWTDESCPASVPREQ